MSKRSVMSKRNKRPPSRFDAVPASVRPRLQVIAIICGIALCAGSVALLATTSYLTGFSPNNDVYRSGTVKVSRCSPMPHQLGMQACLAQLVGWNSDVRPGVDLTDSPQVMVLSRTPLSGTVDVVSRMDAFTSYNTSTGYRTVHPHEVIVPVDARPLPNLVKALMGIGCVVMAFVGTYLGGRIAWEIVLRRAKSKQRAG